MIERKPESVGHHTDHRVGKPAQGDGPANDLRIGGESRLPGLIANDDDLRRARLFVRGQQIAPEQRRSAGDRKPRRRHLGQP